MIAEYLGKCRLIDEGGGQYGITGDSTVIVTDSDVLINTSPAQLLRALDSYADDIDNDQVVFSAEGPCVTVNKNYRKALCGSFEKRSQQEGNPRECVCIQLVCVCRERQRCALILV